MKTLRALLALSALAFGLAHAQDAATDAAPGEVRRTPAELEKLLAPVALYPDALIAIMLPAATAPADVVLAARHLRDNPGDRSQIEHRAWDESVKALTNYPAVLAWMDENLAWTKQVGEAFATQPAEVMQAMQRLRAQARAAGTLVDTPQQQIIAEPDVIRIVPTQPDVIYVPYYEPEVVFVSRPHFGYVHPRPFFTFGLGVRTGSWLAFECDWRRHTIWVGNRHRPWHGHDWRRPLVIAPPIGSAYARTPDVRHWRPPAHTVRPPAPGFGSPRAAPVVTRPTSFAQVENRPAHFARPTVATTRPGETDRNHARRHAPDASNPRPSAPAAIVASPALPTQPALAPTVPPPRRGSTPAPDRTREQRWHNTPPRSQPPTTVVAAPPAAASPVPTAPANQPNHYHRRSLPTAAFANPPPPTTNFPAPGPAPTARPDFRGHSRPAPAVAPAPPASAPAAPTATAPATTTRPHRQGEHRGGSRPGDPQR